MTKNSSPIFATIAQRPNSLQGICPRFQANGHQSNNSEARERQPFHEVQYQRKYASGDERRRHHHGRQRRHGQYRRWPGKRRSSRPRATTRPATSSGGRSTDAGDPGWRRSSPDCRTPTQRRTESAMTVSRDQCEYADRDAAQQNPRGSPRGSGPRSSDYRSARRSASAMDEHCRWSTDIARKSPVVIRMTISNGVRMACPVITSPTVRNSI